MCLIDVILIDVFVECVRPKNMNGPGGCEWLQGVGRSQGVFSLMSDDFLFFVLGVF